MFYCCSLGLAVRKFGIIRGGLTDFRCLMYIVINCSLLEIVDFYLSEIMPPKLFYYVRSTNLLPFDTTVSF